GGRARGLPSRGRARRRPAAGGRPPPAGLSFWVAFALFCPPALVSHTNPSSVPTQSTSGFFGLSAIAVMVPCLVRVSSGEIGLRSSPRLTERNRYCAPQ